MLRPLFDRVIILQDPKEDKSKGGIIIAPSAQQEKPRGTIVAVGPTCKELKGGERVVLNTNWLQRFFDDGKEYVVLNEADVIATIHGE